VAESLPRKQTFFDGLLPEALVEALGRLPQERFDAIVVDEGQDFRRDWWGALQLGLMHRVVCRLGDSPPKREFTLAAVGSGVLSFAHGQRGGQVHGTST
jgi:hypothetical protein